MDNRRGDRAGRIAGIIVFIGGVGLLAFVFALAYDFFNTNKLLPSAAGKTFSGTELGASALSVLVKIVLLLVMAFIASLFTSKGISIYWSASDRNTEARGPKE